jgi:hypothetical protein
MKRILLSKGNLIVTITVKTHKNSFTKIFVRNTMFKDPRVKGSGIRLQNLHG